MSTNRNLDLATMTETPTERAVRLAARWKEYLLAIISRNPTPSKPLATLVQE